MKNDILWDVAPCSSCKNQRIASVIRLTGIGEIGTTQRACLLLTANVVPSSPILVKLMTEVILSSETSVLTRATRSHIPGADIHVHICHCQLLTAGTTAHIAGLQ
jgi:hypothetical protein